MASGRTAEDPVLVLQTHHVDIVEVQEGGRILIGLQVLLRDRPAHPCRIVIPLFRIIYGKRHQSSRSVL